jgi:16S rRNA (guanine527-N7)-methyltransferase
MMMRPVLSAEQFQWMEFDLRKSHLEDLNRVRAVSRETLERLEHFVALFSKWSRAINLAAPSTHSDVWRRHVADSLQIYALNPGPRRWLDLGSGGGFPGVITAILLLETDGGHVDLVESNQKKAAFLRTALTETGARGTVHALRAEAAADSLKGQSAVSARALAELDLLLSLASPWLEAGATAWLHKGRDYRREIAKARRSWSFDLLEHKSRVDADSVILQIDNVRPVRSNNGK